jgi:uncharacterized membrane protein YraQ (UPF0718 family)
VLAVAMAWQVGWSLVLGFTLSGIVQAVVSKRQMRAQLGRAGIREIALASAYGAASSSCSYAAASVSRTLFKKGAAFAPSLAFLFASTNLVIELGIILWVLMGWQFMLAEWVGGVVLIAIMSLFVKLTYPKQLVEAARSYGDAPGDRDDDDDAVAGATLIEKLRNPATRVIVARTIAMEWSMLRDDLIVGFLVAGAIAVFVPTQVWHVLFLQGSSPWIQVVGGTIVGALLAIVTFVCSIGNVPMAAALWSIGMPFGGTLSFLYADLIVLPLLNVYRKYYGPRMAAYIFAAFFVSMVLAALAMSGAFHALSLVPNVRPDVAGMIEHFSFNYTFWLNLMAALAIGYVAYVNRANPEAEAEHHCCHAE